MQGLPWQSPGTKRGGGQLLPAGEITIPRDATKPQFILKSFWRWDGLTFIDAFGGGVDESALETAQGDERNHAALELATARCSISCCQGSAGRNLGKFFLLVLFSNAHKSNQTQATTPYLLHLGFNETNYRTKDWSLRLRPVGRWQRAVSATHSGK